MKIIASESNTATLTIYNPHVHKNKKCVIINGMNELELDEQLKTMIEKHVKPYTHKL